MSCDNCFNGCSDITSDECVKYTGIDIPALNISNGDSLASVLESLSGFLAPVLTGQGITPIINNKNLCALIISFLPSCAECTGYTLNEILTALIKSICSLQTQINNINNTLQVLNADYDVNCLSGVTNSSNTHDVLQAVIDKLCALNTTVNDINNDLNDYVLIDDLDDLIQAYLNSISATTLVNTKMIPYCPIPFWGDRTGKFDINGVGFGDWTKIYLCNGYNGITPDLRGVTLVGNTNMGTNTFPSRTDPAISGNPTYIKNTVLGNNNITLNSTQIPSHTHTATSTVTDTHYHFVSNGDEGNGVLIETTPYLSYYKNYSGASEYNNYYFAGTGTIPDRGKTSLKGGNITVATTNTPTGGGLSHSNIQPSAGMDYIIYIP